MRPRQRFDFIQPFSKILNNYQSKLWYQLLVSRSEMFERADKTKRGVNWFLNNKINTLKFFKIYQVDQ